MTKCYALKRLLEHGPMTPGEMIRCTLWQKRQVQRALDQLKRCGLVRQVANTSSERGAAYEAVL